MISRHLIHRSRNRSQVSLEPPQDPQDNRRPYGDSPLHSPGFPPQSAPSQQYHDREEDHEQAYGPSSRSDEASFYQLAQPTGAQPTRSQSTRSPGLLNTNQPTIQLVGPHSSASTPSSAIDDDPDRYYHQGPPPPVHKVEAHKKKRSFFGLGSSSSSRDAAKVAPQKLGRSISVRRKEEPQPPTYSDSGNHGARQQAWPPSERPPSNVGDEDEDSGPASRSTQYAHAAGSAPPDNDPLHSPAFPPPFAHEEHAQGRLHQPGQVHNNSNRHPLDRRESHQSSWEKTVQQAPKHSRTDSVQQGSSSYHPSPSSATSISSHPFAQRATPENINQYYRDNSRPPSQQSLEPPQSVHYTRGFEYSSRQGQGSVSSGEYTQGSMGPVQGQPPPTTRRSSESTQQSQTGPQAREGGPYQPYNQGAQQGPVPSPNAPPPQYSAQLAPQGQNHRGNTQPLPMAQQGQRESGGRNTPPPGRSRDDLGVLDPEQLQARHDELRMDFCFPFTSYHAPYHN